MALKSQSGQAFPTNGCGFCDMLAGMMFINPESLMASGRQCGVVVVAAGIIQAFTTPGTAVASVIMTLTGVVIMLVCSIELKEERKK